MKKMKIVVILLLMTLGATAVSAQNIDEDLRDNVLVEVNVQGSNLPQDGVIHVWFINPNPDVSDYQDRNFTDGYFKEPIHGKLLGQGEIWSLNKVRVVLGSGSNVYIAEYIGYGQDVRFTASDFHHITEFSIGGTIPDPQYAP